MHCTPASHHKRGTICGTRLPYRDGHKSRAVKVFTVAEESSHLLLHNVPAVGLQAELRALCAQFGQIRQQRVLPDYPHEPFAEVHWVVFNTLPSARLARMKLDDYNFHGAVLHVHYAPELEGVEETRVKLEGRRREVAYRLWRNQRDLQEAQSRKKRQWGHFTQEAPLEAPKPAKKAQYGPRLNPF